MKRHRMPEIKEGGVNVTPLIDVVMCMIIFFLLATKIGVNDGADKSITVPVTQWGKDLKDTKGNLLTLNVRQRDAGGEPLVTGMVPGAKDKPIEVQLVAGSHRPLLEILTKLKKSNDKFGIILRGDQDMPYRSLLPVLTTCMDAGVSNINLDTSKP